MYILTLICYLCKMTKLPTLADLNRDVAEAFKNDQLNMLLNQHPPQAWVKQNKFANNSNYLPIDKVEYLLTRIFQRWRVEVIDFKQMFNAVSCHIRLHYLNPITGQWDFHDGVGAADIQVKAGASASDLASINRNATGMALPIAKSMAIKDAADHLGKLFGRDLNRKDTLEFDGAYLVPEHGELQQLFEQVKQQLTAEEAEHAGRILSKKETASYKKLHTLLKSKL